MVDILEPPTPGYVAQMTGMLTRKKYTKATMYVDKATGYGFINIKITGSTSKTTTEKCIPGPYVKPQSGYDPIPYQEWSFLCKQAVERLPPEKASYAICIHGCTQIE